jgi:hypothetical protein
MLADSKWLRGLVRGGDPIGEAMAEAIADILTDAAVELSYAPVHRASAPAPAAAEPATATATGTGPPGWDVTVVVKLDERVARFVPLGTRAAVPELLQIVPEAALRAATRFRDHHRPEERAPLDPALRRALRDAVATEILVQYLESRIGRDVRADVVGETIDYLIELSGTRVESHELTHGVVISDVLEDAPRLRVAYPDDIRAAKRAPLLFDGQQSVILVDREGRARTELQRHRLERLAKSDAGGDLAQFGSLVAEATRVLHGLGLFLRVDRSIWTFIDGRPLLVRRRERWTAFPLELAASIENMIGTGTVAPLIVGAAFRISAEERGAILAVVDDPSRLDGVVSPKDRYDLRNAVDVDAMQAETRLHHLIDADDLDEPTLVRLASLDGATILDRGGHLLAYGAIVTSSGSGHEGARTAAARTLSEIADVVLNVSVDGDITIFRDGDAIITLLGGRLEPAP